MDQIATGTIHGNTIVLDGPARMPDGQIVQVVIRPVPSTPTTWGNGIQASAGGWAVYPEMESVMEKIHAQRKLERGASSPP